VNSVKDKIMYKALELFSAKGYEGVSVNELTAVVCIYLVLFLPLM